MPKAFVVARFADAPSLLDAVRRLRSHGFSVWDAYSPFPVEGLGEALGLRASRLPWLALGAGAGGLLLALGFQLYVTAHDWPVDVGGKPAAALLPLVPVTFEIAVLAAALGTFTGLLLRCWLFPGRAPRLVEDGTTDDRFALALRRRPGFDAGLAHRLLEESGARNVREKVLEL